MSIVVASVDNDYESTLSSSYQLLKNDDDTYSIYVATSPLQGYFVGEGCDGVHVFDDFHEAWKQFCDLINSEEYVA
jgi:hypothetical protein